MAGSDEQRAELVRELVAAYNAEIETVANYLANSVYLDGALADPIKDSLASDVTEELNHARRLAERLRVLGGVAPGSLDLRWNQKSLQPPPDSTDIAAVIDGVIEAEEDAIARYERIIKLSDDIDPVTQDLAIEILGDEQTHRREFLGYRRALGR